MLINNTTKRKVMLKGQQFVGKSGEEISLEGNNVVYLRQANRSAKKVMLPAVIALHQVFEMVE